MIVIKDRASLACALASALDPEAKSILRRRVEQLGLDFPLEELASFLVVETGDTAPAVERELGFPVLRNLVDGSHFGEPDFEPSWEWIEQHQGWFEAVYVLTDDGFGWVLLVPDTDEADRELVYLCRQFGRKPVAPDAESAAH